jgi:hypothetical protein
VLPSRLSLQRVAYELCEVGQRHIPFQAKRSDLGERYQVDFEKFLCFVLKTFGLYESSQQESVEAFIYS